MEIGVLFNNVGVSYDFSQWFHELLDEEVEALLKLNVESTTWMTRLVLPGMVKRRSGAIVNQSSAAARFPLPLLAGYSAAKGYIENLTRSCHGEYVGKGVHFQCQSPLWVATPMVFPNSKKPPAERATLMVPTPKKYARYAVSSIGYDALVSPYWVHELAIWVGSRLPDFLVVKGILQMHLAVRFNKKCVAKMEEKQKKKQ
jgi:17beta-estradiol 17-dehydrogenase / very-long-chain 3-oxoacyl-CoA reductase